MAAPLRFPKIRGQESESMASSIASLPYRGSNASVSSLFASTYTPTGSRSVSPSGAGTPSQMASSTIFGGTPAEGRQPLPSESPDDPRNLIMQAFVPHVAVHTSADTHELVRDKGFSGGLWELLRPFGEIVQGKVTVRDSIGAGRSWDDFGVRFVQLGDGLELSEGSQGIRQSGEGRAPPSNGKMPVPLPTQRARIGGDINSIEQLVDRHLSHAEQYAGMTGEDMNFKRSQARTSDNPSPFYTLFLRRLLSGIPLAPHETFSHPVACVIAISSRNQSPIETLRKLYDESSHGDKRLPSWVSSEYLRYYVLVHDEERDDITKSMALFDQMKRHFGLHCHLLRLRSSLCAASDDDSIRLPRAEWVSAREEIEDIKERENLEDIEDSYPSIYESDTTAIKTFIREMVTQSIVPSMERNVATWNDQVASRRRGISGRFMSLSKKWTGFGSSSRTSTNGTGTGSSSNYDAAQGFYRPDAPEAVMRKLADYAFMLRDWKLAQSTYELLRSDFNNDKAWKHHAASNEMAAISALMIPQAMSSKIRAETVDQMLETASYSYITRCGARYGALRCLALGMELLRLRGGSATEDAARWGLRLLDNKIVGAVGEALITERIAACYAFKKGSGSERWGARTRKSAVWTILAADAWFLLGKIQQSKQRLDEVEGKYALMRNKNSLATFSRASEYLDDLRRDVQLALCPDSATDGPGAVDELIDNSIEESQAFESRPHRRSLMGVVAPPLSSLESFSHQGDSFEEGEETPKLLQFE